MRKRQFAGQEFDWSGTGQKIGGYTCPWDCVLMLGPYVGQRSHPGIASVSFFADRRTTSSRTRKSPPQELIIPRHEAALFRHV
jgi:hypothetical protein